MLTGFGLDEETLPYAKHVKVPTLMAQLRSGSILSGWSGGSTST
jgi:hypothetical protein